MPLRPELAPAAKVGQREHNALLDEKATGWIELRPDADAEATVSIDYRWVLTVKSCAFEAEDIEGIRVPSLETPNSREASVSLKSTGGLVTKLVLPVWPVAGLNRCHPGGSRKDEF